jgi:hypothetical protein
MVSWRLIAEALVSPVTAFRALAEAPRSLVILVVLIAAQLTIPVALVGRVDSRRDVVRELAQSGKLADTTDRELTEKVQQADKIQVATYAATGLFGPPFRTLLLTLALWIWGRYLRGRPAFGVLWSLCAYAQLPLAVRAVARGWVLSRLPYVYPDQIDGVLPSGLTSIGWHLPHGLEGLLGAADFFRIWTMVLLAVALYASAKISPLRASLGVGVAYAVFAVVAFVGLPRLGGA